MPDTDCLKFKSHDKILLALLSMLFIFGILAFFKSPIDPIDSKEIIRTLGEAVAMVLSFKFGIHQAQAQALPPGTRQLTSEVVPPAQEAIIEANAKKQ